MHTETRHFALKVGLDSTRKERKYNKEFIKKTSFSSKLINGGPYKVQGVGKNQEINRRGPFVRHLRVCSSQTRSNTMNVFFAIFDAQLRSNYSHVSTHSIQSIQK